MNVRVTIARALYALLLGMSLAVNVLLVKYTVVLENAAWKKDQYHHFRLKEQREWFLVNFDISDDDKRLE